MKTTTRDDFEYWLSDMPDALARFIAGLPTDLRPKLNYSLSSLDALEEWLLQRYQSNREMLAPGESSVVDGVARYVGETLRRSIGGRWDIRLDDPKYVYFGLPELSGFVEKSTPVCPHTLATTSVERRKGTFLSGVIRNLVKRYAAKS